MNENISSISKLKKDICKNCHCVLKPKPEYHKDRILFGRLVIGSIDEDGTIILEHKSEKVFENCTIKPDIDIMLIGEAPNPSYNENDSGELPTICGLEIKGFDDVRMMFNPSTTTGEIVYKIMKQIMEIYSVFKDDNPFMYVCFWLTNSVKCSHEKWNKAGRKTKRDWARYCAVHLLKERHIIKPDFCVVFGDKAQIALSLIEEKGKQKDLHATIIPKNEEKNRPYTSILSYHPSWLKKNREVKRNKLINDLIQAIRSHWESENFYRSPSERFDALWEKYSDAIIHMED